MNNLDPGYREAVAVLDGTVVVNGHGAGAMATLTGFVHDEAARSGSSRSDRWLHALTQARMPLGPAVASTTRVTALQVADYRAALSRGLDQLPLNFLGVTAEPIHVENLLDRFRVQLPGTERDGRAETATLGHVARRWPGLCVVGAAGAGKSTALAQLVAAWAVDVDAPLPIHVPMYRLVPPLRDHEPLGLAEIVRLGLGVRDDLAPLLVARLRDGGAALVLDGLDECRDQQDAAVDLIHQLLADLPYSAGLVISARDAVSFKAFATGLPVTVLQEPRDAGAVASMIVAHVMKAAWPNHTPADLASARNWMRQSQSDHPGLWKIPLFATLLAAHAGRATSGVLPTSRAEALVAAITDSVKAWEVTKQWEPRSWQPALSPDQLLDGFIALGHTTASGSASRADAAKAVTDILHVRWDMSAGAASESAEEILAWWVGRVGAFTDQDGDLRPALRLLGEVADAMWASGQPADEAAAWMIKAVQDPTQFRESILLAASLSSALRETLMAEATEAEAVLLAAGAILLGLSASDEEVTRIAERLIELSDHPVTNKEHDRSLLGAINLHQDQRDGPTWKFLLALAKLPPRGGVATVQTRALGTLPEGERRLVLGALTTAASCRFEQRELDDHERMVLQALLNLPAPTKEPDPVRRSRRRFLELNSTQRLVSGHMEAVIAAVEMMGLTQEQAESAIVISAVGSAKHSSRLLNAIRAAGFTELVEEKGPFSGMRNLFSTLGSFFKDGAEIEFILEEAARAMRTAHGRKAEPSWRLTGAASMLELVRYAKQANGHVEWAVENQPDLVRKLVAFVTKSEGLEPAAVAADGPAASELVKAASLDASLLLMIPPDPRRIVDPEIPIATPEDLPWLLECVASSSDWLNTFGAFLIANIDGIDGAALLLDQIQSCNPFFRHRLAAALLGAVSDEELRQRWLGDRDNMVRAAAVEELAERDPSAKDIDDLAVDDDLTIRFAALHGLMPAPDERFEQVAGLIASKPPVMWTCTSCGSSEDMADEDCKACSEGSRSEITDELRDLRRKRSKAPSKAT